jgi:hypothetical protein
MQDTSGAGRQAVGIHLIKSALRPDDARERPFEVISQNNATALSRESHLEGGLHSEVIKPQSPESILLEHKLPQP